MSTTTKNLPAIQAGLNSRLLQEGYGPGAWHGPDLKAALADVTPALAYWRPAPERHNIAEIALHHAYSVRSVRAKLSGRPAEAFVLPGEDWFALSDEQPLSWTEIRTVVESQQQQLQELISGADAATAGPAVSVDERLGLVLGITCHAIYHAGQVQLIKRLHGG